MPAEAFLFLCLLFTVFAVMVGVHFWIMRGRRTKGTALLRVGEIVALDVRHAFTVPAGVRELDFFLRFRRGPGRRETYRLRVHGPVRHEFKEGIRGVMGEHRLVLPRIVPGDYEVELVGPAPAEFTELLVVAHPAVVPARASRGTGATPG